MGKTVMIKGRRASRRRHRRPDRGAVLALILALLVGLLVARGTGLLTPSRGRGGPPLKRGVRVGLAALVAAAFGRRSLQRLALALYLVGASMVLVPAGTALGNSLNSTSTSDVRIYQSIAEAALRAQEAQAVTQYAVTGSGAMARDGRLMVSQVSPAESNVAKMPPVEAVNAASAVRSSVRQGDAASVAATTGIATWYGGGDGFGPEDTMADGSPFNPNDPTIVASNIWPLGTWLTVCHRDICIRVCVRDRGAFEHALDLSMSAFALLAPLSSGVIDVTIEAVP